MPYKIVQVQEDPPMYKVKKDQPGRPVYFSTKPQTYKKALAQLRALYVNTKD